MKINMKYFPMKLHYFFMFAGTAPILPYLPAYARENLGLSFTTIGLIYTLLPFIGLVAKAASGALADFFKVHRQTFLISVAVCGLGFFSIYFVPGMNKQKNPNPANITLDCNHVKTYLRYSLPKVKCGSDAFIENVKKKNIPKIESCQLECSIDSQTMKRFCQYWDIDSSECSLSEPFEFNATTDLLHSDREILDAFFPISNISYKSAEVEKPKCSEKTKLNCTMRCANNDLMEFLGAPNFVFHNTYSEIINEWQFWIFLICVIIAWAGLAVLVVMSDTICFQLLGSETSRYGEQRMFGSIGWGGSVILAGFLIDVASKNLDVKNHAPAFILSLFFMVIDFFVATRLKVQAAEKGVSQFSSIFRLLHNPRIILFVLCCIIVGVSTGVLWTFQILYINEVVYKWDCNFAHLKLLQGLVMGVQCFGGELPFFFVSGYFIKKLGHAHCMSLVIFVFGLRYVLYYIVVNPWYFLPIELTSGFTFGIFYSVMTSYASVVAPASLHATMQGLVGASFEGLGVSIGGFIGGAMFQIIGGAHAFLYVGVYNIVFAALHILAQFVLTKIKPLPAADSPRLDGYLPPTEGLHPVLSDDYSGNSVPEQFEPEET